MNPSSRHTCAEMNWTDGYECLREHALGGPVPSDGWLSSLAMLLQNGVAAWLLAGTELEASPQRTEGVFLALDWLPVNQRETTRLLAEMTLTQLFARTPGNQ
jgi:hypothetical protein